MNTLQPIQLECQWEASWTDAKTRLAVAAETLKFPFCIATDESPVAYKDLEHYMLDQGESEYDVKALKAAEDWFDTFAVSVNNMEEALRTLYPWYHEGEDMPQ